MQLTNNLLDYIKSIQKKTWFQFQNLTRECSPVKCDIESQSCTMLTSTFPGFDYKISVSLAKKL